MRKFTTTFREAGTIYPSISILFSNIISDGRDDRTVETTALISSTFSLTDDEIAHMRARITDPALSRLLTQWDKPAKIVGFYLRQYYSSRSPRELIHVTEIPEILPEELKDAPDLAVNSVTFTPHAPHAFYRPGNPQLSDPWARGW